MIGKVAASGAGFRGIVNYILLGKKDTPNPDRVAWTMAHNLLSENPELAPALMRATANQSVRCKKPVYHLAISWHKDEDPSDDLMRAVGIDTLRDLQLTEHQALFVAHKDTAHKHLHMIINRVHPETGKAWSNSNDFKRIEVSLRRQAEARGLAHVPGRFNDPEKFAGKGRATKNGEVQANIRHGKPHPKSPWGREDIKNLRAVLAPTFAEATSWDELAIKVAAMGFRIAPKGQGLIIEGADGFMKLSDLGKEIRVRTLEDTFGETYATFAGRTTPPADEVLKPGAGLFPDASKKVQNPGQSPRSQDTEKPLHSHPDGESGDEDAFTDTVRDEARRAWTNRRRQFAPKIKPENVSSDDGVPGETPHPDLDPRKEAYAKVRAARAELTKRRRDALVGNASTDQVLEAQQQLEDARRALEDLLSEQADARDAASIAERPASAVPAPKPPAPTPSSRSITQPTLPSTDRDPFAARGEAFNTLRAARQAQDLAEALFNAGVITEKELRRAADDVRLAAEQLQPHLSLEEQLHNDIARALRPKRKRPAPKKGGPSR